jgi:hypothetical protein
MDYPWRLSGRRFALTAAITSCLDDYTERDETNSNLLYLTVESDRSGYVVFGPTLEVLENIHPRFPVTFFVDRRTRRGRFRLCLHASAVGLVEGVLPASAFLLDSLATLPSPIMSEAPLSSLYGNLVTSLPKEHQR